MKKLIILAIGALTLMASDCTPQEAVTTFTITAAPTPLAFGSLPTGYTQPAAQTVTITNTGTGSVTLSLPTVADYYISTLSRTTITAGQTATFTLRPNSLLPAGNYNRTITISGSGGAKATINTTFTVTAGATYTISASPNNPAFGSLPVGYTRPTAQTITITNTGNQSITLNALPANPTGYTLVAGANWTTAFTGGQTRTFTVQPNAGLAAGTYNPTITINGNNGATATVSPTFTVTVASAFSIYADPNWIDFRSVVQGYTQPAAQTITVTNTGTGSITLNTLPAVPNYTLTPGANWTTAIAAGQSRTFTLRPLGSLTAANYDRTITITGSNGTTSTVNTTFSVTSNPNPNPGLPPDLPIVNW